MVCGNTKTKDFLIPLFNHIIIQLEKALHVMQLTRDGMSKSKGCILLFGVR